MQRWSLQKPSERISYSCIVKRWRYLFRRYSIVVEELVVCSCSGASVQSREVREGRVVCTGQVHVVHGERVGDHGTGLMLTGWGDGLHGEGGGDVWSEVGVGWGQSHATTRSESSHWRHWSQVQLSLERSTCKYYAHARNCSIRE